MKVYCLNCKAKRELTNVEEVFVTKNYRIIKGKCTGCGRETHELLERKKR